MPDSATPMPPAAILAVVGMRSEAARLVAALHRGAVENLFSGHLAIFQRQVVDDLIEWHSGGVAPRWTRSRTIRIIFSSSR